MATESVVAAAPTLTTDVEDGVLVVTMDSPGEPLNTLSPRLIGEFEEIFGRVERDVAIQGIVLISGKPESFIVGADIEQFLAFRDAADAERLTRTGQALLGRLAALRAPVVAAIHGPCLGGGLEVALACDLRYCGESAQFGIPAARLGLAYNIEGHKRLLETVGHARAKEIMFLGRRYPAGEALAMGLVNRVLQDTELEAYVSEVLKTLSENAPLSIANSKAIIEEYVKSSGAPDTGRMAAAIERCAKSADYQEGRRAFMEKRKPAFKGK